MTSLIRALICFAVIAAGLGAADPPQPPVIDPGGPEKAPSDAVVLFDGADLSEWVHNDGTPAKWNVRDGAMICNTGTGNILTKRRFGSAQIHIEFSTPLQAEAKGQARANSGVYLQGRYELQVLDSYQNPTYPDGSAGAIYKQSAPAVNASRPPREWQSYDIIFQAPACEGGSPTSPATVTILHNGVLIQDHFALQGPTPGAIGDSLCEPGPILLQDHIHHEVKETPLRFRNIWVRELN